MPTQVWILVYKGDPIDYTEYRHTGLFLQWPDATTSLLHVRGTQGIFEFETRENYDAEQSRALEHKIFVSQIPDSISKELIKSVVSNTPAKNGPRDRDWNCQSWVADALTRMVNSRHMDIDTRSEALDKMTDAILEATDEE